MNNAIRVGSLALFLVLAGSAKAEAQEWWWGLTYQTALPSGDTKDIVDQFSWRNVGFEGRKMLKPNASVGRQTWPPWVRWVYSQVAGPRQPIQALWLRL